VEKFRHPLLLNGPHAVYRALAALWRASYVLTDERRAAASGGDQRRHVSGDMCHVGFLGPGLVARPAAGKAANARPPEGRGAAPSGCKAQALPLRLAAREEPDKPGVLPLTRSVSRATRGRRFLSTRPGPWAYQCHPQWREAACAGETIRALERVAAHSFLEPGTRPRIHRGKLR
jgi:hypothetical protein